MAEPIMITRETVLGWVNHLLFWGLIISVLAAFLSLITGSFFAVVYSVGCFLSIGSILKILELLERIAIAVEKE